MYMVAMVRDICLKNDFFPGQGKVRDFCCWSEKFGKDLKSEGKSQGIRKLMGIAVVRKYITLFKVKGCTL